MPLRHVIDTNVYVSGAIFPSSVPRQAISRVLYQGVPLLSEATWSELVAVFRKPKLARYLETASIREFLASIRESAEMVSIPTPIHACRDPRDDKFLELAVHGHADVLITGDTDLLALHPFQGVAILTPAAFLARDSAG